MHNVYEELVENVTVYISYPNHQRYTEIVSPKHIYYRGNMVDVVTSNGAIYTTHATNVLIITKPKKEENSDG